MVSFCTRAFLWINASKTCYLIQEQHADRGQPFGPENTYREDEGELSGWTLKVTFSVIILCLRRLSTGLWPWTGPTRASLPHRPSGRSRHGPRSHGWRTGGATATAGGTAESRTTSGRAAAPEDGEGTCRAGATGQDSRWHSFWTFCGSERMGFSMILRFWECILFLGGSWDVQILQMHYDTLRIDDDPFSWYVGLQFWSDFAEEKRIENW